MDTWALRYSESATFICISCAGPQLSGEFAKTLKLRACVNAWCDDDDMPTWGQLGCSGFIVMDGSGAVVCKSSPAFMEVRELAFQYVETLLDSLIGAKPPPDVAPGMTLRIAGLRGSPQLNGQLCVCLTAADAGGRHGVQLSNGRQVSVKAANLEASGAPLVRGCGAGGGCGDCCDDGCDADGGKDDGCALQLQEEAEPEPRRDAKRPLPDSDASEVAPPVVGSVKVEALDHEHERCAVALGRLATERSVDALKGLLREYEQHFAHEEELLDTHLYAGIVEGHMGFSADANARTSHRTDHKRMLDEVRSQIAQAGSGVVPVSFVEHITREFERHAEAYDGSYADRLSAALAA